MIHQEALDFHQAESEVKAEVVDKEDDLEAETVETKTYRTMCRAYTILKVSWII